MAFKMRGNPFPKKGGAFKQDINVEYDKELEKTGSEYTQHVDSMNVIMNDLKLDAENAEEKYKSGDITHKDYKKTYDLYSDFVDKFNIESEEKFEAGTKHMQEFGDSLSLALTGDLDAFNVVQNQYLNDEIPEKDYLAALQALKEKRGSSIVEEK